MLVQRLALISLCLLTFFSSSVPLQQSVCAAAAGHVQSAIGSGTSASRSVSFPAATSAGNLIVVSAGWGSGTATAAVSDSAGNVYQSAVGPVTNGSIRAQIWYAENIRGGSNTVTVTFSASAGHNVEIHEYAGVTTAGALDAVASGTGASTTPTTSALTPTQADVLLFAYANISTTVTWTAGSGYTIRQSMNRGASEDRSVASLGSYAGSFTTSASGSWNALLAAFRATPSIPDTTPPTVSITAPVDGATVSGTAPISAAASDNVGVAGVQFLLDGANLGAEDTTDPYALSWNTTTATNGAHVLTARARDAAGNTTTSNPVTVSVGNTVDTTPPSVPAGLAATAVSASQINLSWNPSTDDVAVTGYRISRSGVAIGTSSATSFNDPGLSPSTTYTYTVAAFDAAGNTSGESAPAAATTQATPPIPTAGLVGAWNFDEGAGTTAADSSGNGNAGTLLNGPAWAAGSRNSGLSFDGINDVVNAGSGPTLDNLPAVTVMAWMKPDSVGENGYGRLAQKGNGTLPTAGFRLFLGGTNSIRFAAGYTTTSLERRSASNAATIGQWQHVAATWDGTSAGSGVRLYKDGVEVSYATTINGAGARGDDSAANLWIGNNDAGNRTFSGGLDEVKVYNRVLSPTEIQTIVQAETPPPPPLPPLRSNGQPSGTLPPGTTQATLTLNTNENATCRYSRIPATAYLAMLEAFTTTDGTSHATTVAGLSDNNTYAYYVRCQDTGGDTNPDDFTIAFSVAAPDSTPPGAITDLSAVETLAAFPSASALRLSWTAPGDDGLGGRASSYDVRYSTAALDEASWDLATQAVGEPIPSSAGAGQSMVITGLAANTLYYVGMKTADEALNVSPLSNIFSAITTAPLTFTCTQIIGLSSTRDWYIGGGQFEPVVGSAAWQLLARSNAFVDLWADPNFVGWTDPLFSPCTQNSASPDRVVLNIAAGTYQGDVSWWVQNIRNAIATTRTKYPNLHQIVLMPVWSGPANSLCTSATVAAEFSVARSSFDHLFIDEAIAQVVGGDVIAGPSPEARTCADFSDSIGHPTTTARGPWGQMLGQYYVSGTPPSVPAPAVTFPARVNVASAALTDPSGNTWSADRSYSGGSYGYVGNSFMLETTSAIANTTNDALYQKHRRSGSGTSFSYLFDVPNGTYTVRLMFAEIASSAFQLGARVGDIFIEGTLLLDNFDVFAQAGAGNTAIDRTFTVTVTDGQLTITIVPVVGQPAINAIEVAPAP